ncbi:unnamed protein product [Rhizophagus irregularis]|nr:unnamed protein product [Rhizophagus irregularis]
MYTKIIALVVNAYLVSKASIPPSQDVSTKKVISTEGRLGIIIGNFIPKSTIIFVIMQTFIYIYMMFLQEIGSIPILNHKISDWNSLETVIFCLGIGGTSLRLWCFKCLKEYFTFNITVKKNHKLITTGPYSLIAHPAYTGGGLMIINVIFLWYQLCSYVPEYFPASQFGSFIWLVGWWNIITQSIFLSLIFNEFFMKKSY